MDAGKKPTGTCLWRPAKYTKCAQMRFRDLNHLNILFLPEQCHCLLLSFNINIYIKMFSAFQGTFVKYYYQPM